MWVTVAGLGEGGKEAPILVGILSCDEDLKDLTLEETLSEVVVKARERLGQDVAIGRFKSPAPSQLACSP